MHFLIGQMQLTSYQSAQQQIEQAHGSPDQV
jgi:hypothetical protein